MAWWWTTGTASDSSLVTLPASQPPGVYELRLFAQDSTLRLARSNALTVTSPGPILTLDLATVAAGGILTASWQGIAAPTATDWVALFPISAPDTGYVAWWYTGSVNVLDSRVIIVPASLPPGTYELRFFANGTLQRLARSNASVVY